MVVTKTYLKKPLLKARVSHVKTPRQILRLAVLAQDVGVNKVAKNLYLFPHFVPLRFRFLNPAYERNPGAGLCVRIF